MDFSTASCHDWLTLLHKYIGIILEHMDTTGKEELNYNIINIMLKIVSKVYTSCLSPI